MLRNRNFIAVTAIGIMLLVGCSIGVEKKEKSIIDDKPTQERDEYQSSENLEKLFSQEIYNLKIKQNSGSFYGSRQQFAKRIIEKLKENKQYRDKIYPDRQSNLVLRFEGYKDIYLDTENGYFWFAQSEQIYKIMQWDEELWERHILKEVNGQIVYYGFEKDILAQTFIDVNADHELDEVELYYDGDLRLKVKDKDLSVLTVVPEKSIESLLPYNQMRSHLYVKEDPQNQRYMFLVGSRYTFTNRYGSTSWLSCYEYNDGKLKRIWDAEDILRSKVITKDYKDNVLTVKVEEKNIEIEIKLTKEEADEINKYVAFLEEADERFIGKDYFFFAAMSDYMFYDYDNDGKEDLITTVHMRGGAAGITEIILFVYHFNEDGVELKEIIPSRENRNLVEIVLNKED